MSGKLNTKDIKTGGGGLPKLLQPGNTVCTIKISNQFAQF